MSVEYIGLFSGGKDSLVTCHKAWKDGIMNEVIYCRTGVGLNEDYVKETCKKYGWELTIVEPAKHETFEIFVERFSFPHQGMHGAIMGFLKGHPLRKWNREQKKLGRKIIYLSGRRLSESARRKRMKSNTEKANFDGMDMWSYIFKMSTIEVWKYIGEHDLKRSPTYETMHLSGDCLCGSFSTKGESAFLKMFHPEMAKRFLELEKKFGGKWGNQISLSDMEHQTQLDDMICSECVVGDTN